MTNFSLHHKVEALTGSGDLRLIYGMGVPFFLTIVVECVMIATSSAFLVIALFPMIFALTAVVLLGLSKMLADEDGSDSL
jgi:hypothetical protein